MSYPQRFEKADETGAAISELRALVAAVVLYVKLSRLEPQIGLRVAELTAAVEQIVVLVSMLGLMRRGTWYEMIVASFRSFLSTKCTNRTALFRATH